MAYFFTISGYELLKSGYYSSINDVNSGLFDSWWLNSCIFSAKGIYEKVLDVRNRRWKVSRFLYTFIYLDACHQSKCAWLKKMQETLKGCMCSTLWCRELEELQCPASSEGSLSLCRTSLWSCHSHRLLSKGLLKENTALFIFCQWRVQVQKNVLSLLWLVTCVLIGYWISLYQEFSAK